MLNETSNKKHASRGPPPPYAFRAPQAGTKSSATTSKAATPVPDGLTRLMLEFAPTELKYAFTNPQDERRTFKINLTANQVYIILEAGSIRAETSA